MGNATGARNGAVASAMVMLPAALARLAAGLPPDQLDDLARGLVETEQLIDGRSERITLDFDRRSGPALRHETCGRVIGLGEAGEIVCGLADAVRDQAAGR